MNSFFVLVNCNIHCKVWDASKVPVYRLYVNDELFAERAWTWHNSYLKELLQIQAPAGLYQIKLHNLDTESSTINLNNVCIKQGAARILQNNYLEIQSCE